MNLILHVDSAKAKAIASRSGVGQVRHLEVQAALKEKRFALVKVPGRENPTNILTKSLGLKDFEVDISRVGARPARRPAKIDSCSARVLQLLTFRPGPEEDRSEGGCWGIHTLPFFQHR